MRESVRERAERLIFPRALHMPRRHGLQRQRTSRRTSRARASNARKQMSQARSWARLGAYALTFRVHELSTRKERLSDCRCELRSQLERQVVRHLTSELDEHDRGLVVLDSSDPELQHGDHNVAALEIGLHEAPGSEAFWSGGVPTPPGTSRSSKSGSVPARETGFSTVPVDPPPRGERAVGG